MSNRILVTGSRTWTDAAVIREALCDAFRSRPDKDASVVVVHGGAKGADSIAAQWVRDFSCVGNPITAECHPADWQRLGRGAGLARNADMVAAGAFVCLAFIRDESRGATHCAGLAEQAGIKTIIHRSVTPPSEGTKP